MGNGGDGLSPSSTDQLFNRALSIDGLGTGSIDQAVDGSVANKDFWIEALEGERLLISRGIINYKDTGAFDANKYGNGIALTNGIQVWIQKAGSTKIDFLSGLTIKTNTDWGQFNYDVTISSYGIGDEALTSRWTLAKYNGGKGILLEEGDKFGVRIRDDLTGLNVQTIVVEGVLFGTMHSSWTSILAEL